MVGFVVFFCTDVTRCHGLLVCWFVGLFLYDFDCVFGVVGMGCGVLGCGWCGVCGVGYVGCVGGIGLKVPSKN